MFAKLKNSLSAKSDKALAIVVASPLAMSALGLTSSGGVVQFEQADKDAIGQGFSNAISNLWAGFTAVLPYLGMAAGVLLILGIGYKLIFKRG